VKNSKEALKQQLLQMSEKVVDGIKIFSSELKTIGQQRPEYKLFNVEQRQNRPSAKPVP
jgi:hypothetical protein